MGSSLLQTELVLEKYEVYNPIPLIVGSSLGGLLLLALITALLYKVSVFIPLLRPPASGPALPQTGSYRGKNSGNGVRLV